MKEEKDLLLELIRTRFPQNGGGKNTLKTSAYQFEKHIKDDSAAYLKSWLKSLKEDAQFIKTILLDVKRASGMMTQHLDEVA